MTGSASQFSREEGRQADGPGAKLAGTGTHGLAPRDDGRVAVGGEQSTFVRGQVPGLGRGNVPIQGRRIVPSSQARNLYAPEAHHSSALRPLTTRELTKEVQTVVLAFPARDVVDDTQASIRAIENVRNGESGMSLKTFVNLCRANPRARAMAAPLLGYGDESDPNVVQAISVLLNQLVRSDTGSPDVRNDGHPKAPLGDGENPYGEPQLAIGDLFEGDTP